MTAGADDLSPGAVAQVACILEATARKPGNVHRFADFDGTTYLDFILSAQAIARPLDDARETGVGAAVLRAVAATRRVAATNTNLGMVLLLAPLCAVGRGGNVRGGLTAVLEATTVDDARKVYEAVRLANPGGLGGAESQDVSGEPTVTLVEAMRLAAGRDSVARQYANAFADVFELGLPALTDATAEGRPTETAIVLAHLRLMAALPDTLIARKRGPAEAAASASGAAEVLRLGWPDTAAARRRFDAFDAWLRAVGHARNPGTTADLVSAALYLALLDGTIALPAAAGWGW